VNSTTPVQVSGITIATTPAGGILSSCVRLSDGTVWCTGSNFYGQLGNGTSSDSSTPVQVTGITTAVP
jgi:alpha-tubulin suppressor-like RCC1 family protein